MFSNLRNALFAALVVSLALGWFVAGHYAYDLNIGLDVSAYPAGEMLQGMLAPLVVPITLGWARDWRWSCSACRRRESSQRFSLVPLFAGDRFPTAGGAFWAVCFQERRRR